MAEALPSEPPPTEFILLLGTELQRCGEQTSGFTPASAEHRTIINRTKFRSRIRENGVEAASTQKRDQKPSFSRAEDCVSARKIISTGGSLSKGVTHSYSPERFLPFKRQTLCELSENSMSQVGQLRKGSPKKLFWGNTLSVNLTHFRYSE